MKIAALLLALFFCVGCTEWDEQKAALIERQLERIPFDDAPAYMASLVKKEDWTQEKYDSAMQIWQQTKVQRDAMLAWANTLPPAERARLGIPPKGSTKHWKPDCILLGLANPDPTPVPNAKEKPSR